MMNRDFTLSKFRQLCGAISNSNYEILTLRKYLRQVDLPDRFIIVRHDIDVNIDSALEMAKVEQECGIFSTYYVRFVKSVFKPEVIREIVDMGHEIGYHYEVLDKAKGDKKEAMKIFGEELSQLRKVCDIDTICMHGNPLTSWFNRDLWKEYRFEDYDILGEPYLSIDFEDVLYLSDTGRNWGNKYKVKDTVNSVHGKEVLESIRNTDEVIELLKQRTFNKIFILSHPRWNDGFSPWFKELVLQNAKNMVKANILMKNSESDNNGDIK